MWTNMKLVHFGHWSLTGMLLYIRYSKEGSSSHHRVSVVIASASAEFPSQTSATYAAEELAAF